ncbi:MAG TPA: hypothetical protein DCP31_18460 [Cyanobacteria bacterium UBA8543]|nr:hypothetical protein [Cyanobacteria bacterium UBA8543]
MRLIVKKTNQSLIVSAFFCYLVGGVAIAFGLILFLFDTRYIILSIYGVVFGIALLIGGAFYGRAGKKRSNI